MQTSQVWGANLLQQWHSPRFVCRHVLHSPTHTTGWQVASPSAAAVPDSPDGSKQTASEQNQVAAVQARGTKSLNSKLQLEESSGTCAEKCPPQEHQLCGTSCKVTVGVILASVLVVAINKTGK